MFLERLASFLRSRNNTWTGQLITQILINVWWDFLSFVSQSQWLMNDTKENLCKRPRWIFPFRNRIKREIWNFNVDSVEWMRRGWHKIKIFSQTKIELSYLRDDDDAERKRSCRDFQMKLCFDVHGNRGSILRLGH